MIEEFLEKRYLDRDACKHASKLTFRPFPQVGVKKIVN